MLIGSVFFLVLGIVSQQVALHRDHEDSISENFRHTFQLKLDRMHRSLDDMEGTITATGFNQNFQQSFNDLLPLYDSEGLGFLVSRGAELVFWSGNQFSFSGIVNREHDGNLIYLPNGIFYCEQRVCGDFTLYGLIHIKDNYAIENAFIENKFERHFQVPDDFSVRSAKSGFDLPVTDRDGHYLFSLVPGSNDYLQRTGLAWSSVFFALCLLLFLFFIRKAFVWFRHEPLVWRVVVLAMLLFALYWIRILFRFPEFLSAFELFGPSLYAYSAALPSLGDLLILSVFIFTWSYNFAKDFDYPRQPRNTEISLALGFIFLFYQGINLLIGNLILNSRFSFQLNRIDDINQYSLVGYLIIVLLFFSAFIMNLKVIEVSERWMNRRRFLTAHLVLIAVFGVLSYVFRHGWLYMVCLFLITNLSVYLLQKTHLKRVSLSFIIYFVSLYTFFSLLVIQNHNDLRRLQVQRLMAITLYAEHDPAAEVFLKEMQQKISVDSVIPDLLDARAYTRLEEYVNRNYFSGYFRKYDSWISVCDGTDSLLVQPENQFVPCYPFFEQMIEESGTGIPGTSFYYMNNMNGRISYFGKFTYPIVHNPLGRTVFIELKSKLMPEGVGFPELLLDKSLQEPARYKYFSYAKYYKNELVYVNGDYQYNYYISTYNLGNLKQETVHRSWDGYDHLIYNLGDDSFIIVSTRSFRAIDYLISFPYLFVFYFVVSLLIVFAGNASYRQQALVYDLKFRIQASIIAIVLFSLLLVASGTIYYNLREYQNKHQTDLNEKMKSVSEEIGLRLKNVDGFTPEILDWLWQDLGELSNIFRTDINIYGFSGDLLASSRPEVFNRGIISTRMDAKAFYELTENYQVSITQPEKIGNLSFLSIYEPIINSKGEYLGFINLPYFTRGDELRQEVTTFIVAFINLYVLLFFVSVVVALLLANRITRPLSLLRERLKGMQLDKKNEHISYSADDEIGALVREYNRKVEELADSAEMLARTEREMAWREMAKQIAHEIKNPLTPMKLHIQHLQRAKQAQSEHYDEIFERVTRTLIEQIDTLSDIATEFSNFAKMPNAKNEVFNLVERLRQVADLFESTRQMRVVLDTNGMAEALVLADKEQLSRAVINLIKNGMQSVPAGRKGLIRIGLERNETHAVIGVSDNGCGIPENIRSQLFQPNFTTKSSGMGLGLAIVKRIVESANGRIWFDTVIDQGSTFYIELPLFDEE